MLAGLAAQTPTQDALARLLDHIFDAQRIAHVQLLAEGLCNFNYRVELNDGSQPCVVRIYGRAPEACQKEAALLQLLRAHVPVPEVLHVHARGCCDIGPFIVMRHVAGITFRQLRRTQDETAIAEAAYSIGETLAALGRYRFAQTGMLGANLEVSADRERNGAQALPELIDACLASPTLCQRLDADVRARVHALAWARAPELTRLQTETCLVHGDFNNRNIIVRRERAGWRVAALLDWEFARSGSPLFDIASFLQYEHLHRPSREPHFSRGYQRAGGKLPEAWWQLARIVGLSRQCETLTQLDLPAEIVTEVAELVRETTAEVSL
jgi:fructokinase